MLKIFKRFLPYGGFTSSKIISSAGPVPSGVISSAGFTLLELLIAISFVAMIILGIVAIDVAARKFLTASERETTVQNEASFILEHIVKQMNLAVGNINASSPPIRSTFAINHDARIKIWVSRANPLIPGSVNRIVGYRHRNYDLQYCANAPNDNPISVACTGGWVTLSNRLLDNNTALLPSTWGLVADASSGRNLCYVTVRSRLDPASAVSPDNPQVELKTAVCMRQASAR